MVNFRTLQQRTALIGVNARRNAVSTMADDRVFKAVVNDSTTKVERKNAKDAVRTYSPSYQTDVEGNNYNALLGKKIGDEIPGENVHEDMTGYTLKVTGGSDKTGTPMRSDLHGGGVNAVLVGPGVGYKGKRYVRKNGKVYRYKYGGIRRRRNLRGNTISTDTRQINLTVVKKGSRPLGDIFGAGDQGSE